MKAVWTFAVAFALPITASGAEACLTYTAPKLALSGRLLRSTFAGPPNFESIATGDRPEIYYLLHLDHPTCVSAASTKEDDPDVGVEHLTAVQLNLDDAGFKSLRPYIGKHIVLNGDILPAVSAHHHTPVLLENVSLARIGLKTK